MKESTIRSSWYLILVWILIFGCARVSTPSGGPKDKESPVIIKSVPLNGTTNFSGREIVVSFNEYVVLDKINDKFMVSPPMKTKPEILVRGKSIHIKYENELRDSTTYTFYFQDAIRDLNEGNPINNYQFVFSTGPFIDSLSVTGNVFSGLSLDPPENTIVLLYSQLADSMVSKQIPAYITRVENNGEFRIDNVHPGAYRLYALTDIDNSKNYNNRDEAFAFYPDTVYITPEKNFLPVTPDTTTVKPVNGKTPFIPPVTGEYQLVLYQAEKKMHYLSSSSRPQAYQLTYTLSLPPDTMKFGFSIPDVSPDRYFIEQSRARDTITVWLRDSALYNRPEIVSLVDFPFTDSLGFTTTKNDTIKMRYLAPRPVRGRAVKRIPYKVETGISGQVRPDKRIILTAPSPFLPPDTSKMLFYELLKEGKVRHSYSLAKDTSNSCRYFVNTDLRPGKSYLFIADSAAFRNIYGDCSDSTGTRFNVMNLDLFGKLILDIRGYEGAVVIQLLDNTEKLIRQTYINKSEKIEFPLLEKGNYRLRAIFDLDNNGKWTSGDYETHRQPEPVMYLPKEIQVPENWEVNEIWALELKNLKEPKLQKIKPGTR